MSSIEEIEPTNKLTAALEKSIAEDRYNLITQNLQEVLNPNLLKDILQKQKRDPVIYWGTAPTSTVHLGYVFCMLKIIDLIQAGCHIKILIADLHAVMDSLKSSFENVNNRSIYYQIMIKQILLRLGVTDEQLDKIEFVKGTDFQLSQAYTMDVYRANSVVSFNEAHKAGSEVVKQSTNPVMNSLIYPVLQALDMVYLNADAHFCGVDQRKINVFANEILPRIGKKKGFFLMNPMISALSSTSKNLSPQEEEKKGDGKGEKESEPKESEPVEKNNKMSASNPNSKIDLLDDLKTIKKKVGSAYCLAGDVKDNTPLELTKTLIFPVLNRLGRGFIIERPEKYGGTIEYKDYGSLELDFQTNKNSDPNVEPEYKLHPSDLKIGIISALDFILEPLRAKFAEPDMMKIVNAAYPTNVIIKAQKQNKKEKPKADTKSNENDNIPNVDKNEPIDSPIDIDHVANV
jgi:tyrosyl-tRNA synthetase